MAPLHFPAQVYNTTSKVWSRAQMSVGRTLFDGAAIGHIAVFGCGEGDGAGTADIFGKPAPAPPPPPPQLHPHPTPPPSAAAHCPVAPFQPMLDGGRLQQPGAVTRMRRGAPASVPAQWTRMVRGEAIAGPGPADSVGPPAPALPPPSPTTPTFVQPRTATPTDALTMKVTSVKLKGGARKKYCAAHCNDC